MPLEVFHCHKAVVDTNYKLWHDTNSEFYHDYMRADLIKQRPDVAKAWLNAELDAQLFLADPKNAMEVAQMAAQQATGFTEKMLWASLYGKYPEATGGAPVRMGITWNVVVAAEMISGGGGSASGGGLGFFIWNSYVGGSYEQIVVGMISIGIAGYACSELLRALGGFATPWIVKR